MPRAWARCCAARASSARGTLRHRRSRPTSSLSSPTTGRSSRAGSTFCWRRMTRSPGCRARSTSREANMYVAVKGGERAIDNAHELLARKRRGDPAVPELTLEQIAEQLALACDRVMAEGSLYDRELAALAIKQARGDLVEAIFLVRVYRTTLPRFGASEPIDTGAMEIRRRMSAAVKGLPGGQVLGPAFVYTHRLLDTELAEPAPPPSPSLAPSATAPNESGVMPRVTNILGDDGLIER